MGTRNVTGIGQVGSDVTHYNTRMSVKLSDGTTVLAVKELNSPGAVYGTGGGTTTVRLYKFAPTDAETQTQISTTGSPASYSKLSIAVDKNDNIHMVMTSSDLHTMWYRVFDWASQTWGSYVTVLSAGSTVNIDTIDLAISDGNQPVIAYQTWTATTLLNVCKIATLGTGSGGTWTHTTIRSDTYTADKSQPCEATSVVSLTGGSSAARPGVVAFGLGYRSTGADMGVFVYSYKVDEATGVLSSVTVRHSSVCSGDSNPTSSRIVNRNVKLYRKVSVGPGFVFAISHSEVNKTLGIIIGSWDGTTYVGGALQVNHFYWPATTGAVAVLATSYGSGVVYFMYLSNTYSGRMNALATTVVIDGSTPDGNLLWFDPAAAYFPFDNTWASNYISIFGNEGNFNNDLSDQPTHSYSSVFTDSPTSFYVFYETLRMPQVPVDFTPSTGATVTTSTPALSGSVHLGYELPWSGDRIKYQFATDAAFSTNVKTYIAPHNVQGNRGTQVTGVNTVYRDTLPTSLRLPQGTWYYRTAIVNDLGDHGPWSDYKTVTVSHPPAAQAISPINSQILAWNGGVVTVRWNFSDSSITDNQTKYQAQLLDASGNVLLDSGIVSVPRNFHTFQGIPTAQKALLMHWQVRVWDTDNVSGPYSAPAYFRAADPPSVSISTPANGAVLTSGIPTITFTPSMPGRTITDYEIRVTQGSTIVWQASAHSLNIADGTPVTITAPGSFLKNSQSYSYSVTITDSLGMTGVSPTKVVTTSWSAPAAPTGVSVSIASYNIEDQGYNLVTWSDFARDSDFASWIVLRRDDHINPLTGAVIAQGTYKEIARITDVNTGGYQFQDYTAPSGYKVNYLVRQEVNRFGDYVDSTNNTDTTVYPKSDGYWLIEINPLTTSTDAVRLANVTAETFTEEWERAEYVVIGRGRHVDRGTNLGAKGSLTAQIRDSATQTARQKRLRLKAVQEENKELYIRNPFGDLFKVAVGDIEVSRVAGVGTSEFVDVTLPYSEVG